MFRLRKCKIINHSAIVKCTSLFLSRCAENMKKSAYADLANDLEISKAIAYLRRRDYDQVTLISVFSYVVAYRGITYIKLLLVVNHPYKNLLIHFCVF